MGKKGPQISVEYEQDITIVTPTAEKILEESDIHALEVSILPLTAHTQGIKLVIDFVNVKFLTSAALGFLIRLSKRTYESGGQLKLCGIDRKILEIFRITRLDRVFEIYPDRHRALRSFE